MAITRFKNWWFLAVNGILFLLFGFLVILNTREAIEAMIKIFGYAMLGIGILVMIFGINNFRKDKQAGLILFESIAVIAIGLILGFFPQASIQLFMILAGIWIVIMGIIQLAVLATLREAPKLKNGLLINGLLTLALGIALFFDPFSWAVFLVKMIGVLALLFGILLIIFSFLLQKAMKKELDAPKITK